MPDGAILCPLSIGAERHPNRACAMQGARPFSYQKLDAHAASMASWLRNQGVKPGSRILLRIPPGPIWIPILFGCLRERVIVCPLNTRLPEPALRKQTKALEPWRVLQTPPRIEPVDSSSGEVFPDALATVLHTSGSGGAARAVVHRLSQHLASAEGTRVSDELRESDLWLNVLPLYHVGGLSILFRCVTVGATVVFPDDQESPLNLLARGRVTHASLVPTQLQRLMDLAPNMPGHSKVRRILLGGAPADASLLEQALDGGWPVATSYGSTETASQIASTPLGADRETVRGTSGRVLPHASIRISSRGELCVSGSSLCEGIWEHGTITPLTDAEGWFATGDIADTDAEGWVRIRGRMDRMFISGGENIHPERIEQVLRQITGRQVVVVPVPDAQFGERPGAWIEGPITDSLRSEWDPALRNLLPGYMIPIGYRVLPPQSGLKPDWAGLTLDWSIGL